MKKIELPKHYYKYWTGLIRPKGFELDKDSLTSSYGKFYIRPLGERFWRHFRQLYSPGFTQLHDGFRCWRGPV